MSQSTPAGDAAPSDGADRVATTRQTMKEPRR